MIIELGLLLWFGARYMKKRLEEQEDEIVQPQTVQSPIGLHQYPPAPPTTINNYFAIKVEHVDLRISPIRREPPVEPPDYY